MAKQPTAVVQKKKQIETFRREKMRSCRVICICSLTSTIHVLVPILKVLSRIGNVQVISEDKSVMLLGERLDSEFEIGDIRIETIDEIIMLDEDVIEGFNNYDYTILITQDFLPSCKIDKYIMLNRRQHFKEQFSSAKQRYTPVFSVLNPAGLSKTELLAEKDTVFVNERLLPLPSFAVCQDYLSVLMTGVGTRKFKVNEKIVKFVVEALNGIEECTPTHIKRILMEGGELFVSTS